MERDGEEPTENTSESSPLIQQTASGSQSPVHTNTPRTEATTSQESAGRFSRTS